MESQNTKDVIASYKFIVFWAIIIAVITASFLGTMWFIMPFILKRIEGPEFIIILFIILCLGAVGCGYRIKAEKLVRKQKSCKHKYIGNYCPQCAKTFNYN